MNFKAIGFLLTTLLGVISLLLPVQMATLLGYGKKLTSLGNIEFRVTYGAFFTTLGAFGFYFNTYETRIIIGSSWLAAGIVRLIIFFLKRTDVKENLVGLMIELGIAGLLLVG